MRCPRALPQELRRGFTLALAAAALAACATVPAGPPPPPPELAFQGVKTVALIHRLEVWGDAPRAGEVRRRDPLDALQGALVRRGAKTVTVELTDRPPPELAAVDLAARQAEWMAQGARPEMGGTSAGTLGERAAPALDQLGADAFVVYARGGGWGAPPPPRLFGARDSMAPPPAPVSAIALVARNGTVVTFAWGGGALPYGDEPANAAEAVDAALALLLPPPAE